MSILSINKVRILELIKWSSRVPPIMLAFDPSMFNKFRVRGPISL